MGKNKEYIIKGECTVHFKTGLALNGDLSDFLFCEDTKAMRKMLADPEVIKQLADREMAFVNLDEVAVIDVKQPRVVLPQL